MTLQSTGTISPGFIKIVSPTFNTFTSTTSTSFSFNKLAFLAFISAICFILSFDFSTAWCSINSPSLNSNITNAPSVNSPITHAATTAIAINVSSSKFNLNIFFIPSNSISYPANIIDTMYIPTLIFSGICGINVIAKFITDIIYNIFSNFSPFSSSPSWWFPLQLQL